MLKPFWFKTFSISIITALLVACTSNTKNTQIPTTSNGSDPQQFGAKYTNRTYQQTALVPVSYIENQSAVINQGDFLTQLSNIKNYSSKLSTNFYDNYEKITNWVLSGANINELTQFNIQPQVMRGFDGFQNVLMTGYYSPILYARHSPQGQFKNPIYRMPVKKTSKSSANLCGSISGKRIRVSI